MNFNLINCKIYFSCFIFVFIFISVETNGQSFITKQTKDNILNLQDIELITSMLISRENQNSSSTVIFKKDNCPNSLNKNDDDYFLQTINHTDGLPSTYVPKNLVNIKSHIKTAGNVYICVTETAAQDLFRMSEAMKKEGLSLIVISGYRSQLDQKFLYDKYAPTMNKGLYHRVAPPGHSEHQLGTTIDVASEFKSGKNFALSDESVWLKNNGHNYGFLISYEEGHEYKTGYMYEPWHIRYVGIQNSTLLHKGDYSLAYKSIYYKKTFMNNLLGNLKDFVHTQDIKDESIGG